MGNQLKRHGDSLPLNQKQLFEPTEVLSYGFFYDGNLACRRRRAALISVSANLGGCTSGSDRMERVSVSFCLGYGRDEEQASRFMAKAALNRNHAVHGVPY